MRICNTCSGTGKVLLYAAGAMREEECSQCRPAPLTLELLQRFYTLAVHYYRKGSDVEHWYYMLLAAEQRDLWRQAASVRR